MKVAMDVIVWFNRRKFYTRELIGIQINFNLFYKFVTNLSVCLFSNQLEEKTRKVLSIKDKFKICEMVTKNEAKKITSLTLPEGPLQVSQAKKLS